MRHVGPISGVAAHSARYIGTAGYDNQVVLWSAADRSPIARGCHDHLANQCQFSQCGRLLVSASSDYSARIWDVPTMQLRAVLNGHDDDLEMAAFSPDGRQVATCSRDRTIRVFRTGGETWRVLKGHRSDVISVLWDGAEHVVSSSDDGTVRRWNVDAGELVETVDLAGVETDTIAMSRARTIYAGNDEGEIVLIGSEGEVGRVPAHQAGVKRLVIDNDRGLLASMSYDRNLALWRIAHDGSLSPVLRTQMPPIVWPRSAAFLGDEGLVTGTFGTRFAYYDFRSQAWSLEGVEAGKGVNAVCVWKGQVYSVGDAGIVRCNDRPVAEMGSLCNFLLPFGDRLLTGGQLGHVFDALTGECIHQHRSPLNCGTTFQDGEGLVAVIGSYTGEGLVLAGDARRVSLVRTAKLGENAIKGVACSGNVLFAVCATGTASWFRLPGLSELGRKQDAHSRIANGCAAIPDGRFASVSRDLHLRLWQSDQASILRSPHAHSIKCVAVSNSGRHVATGSYDGSIALYNLNIGEWVRVARPTASGISSLTPGLDSENFLASSYDGQVYEASPFGTERYRATRGGPMQ